MPYSSFQADQLTLRDRLAIDRTVLANERTLLAYLRTAIALLVTGGSLVKLFPLEGGLVVLGWILLGAGGLLALQGTARYVRERRRTAFLVARSTRRGAEDRARAAPESG
jgi:putative membrane protein